MVTVDIKSVQQMLEKKITYKISSQKKLRIVCDAYRYSIKICCFFHTYILEKYFKDKLTMQNGRGKVNRSRPTHCGIGMSLHYA